MYLLQSADELVRLLRDRPDLWVPDHLLTLQEYFPIDPSRGIVRMEFLDNELLYAMRVVSRGGFNLCPSEVCNPENGRSQCEVREGAPAQPVEFYPYHDVPAAAVETGRKLVMAARFDVGGIEYLEAPDGRTVFYDMNANPNLRTPIARVFGFDPFERVVDFLTARIMAVSSLAASGSKIDNA
jgi:hypothetical protein